MAYEAYYQARDTLLSFIRRDAVGPVEEKEILVEPPLETYVCGVLWPKKNRKASAGGKSRGMGSDSDDSVPAEEKVETALADVEDPGMDLDDGNP